MNVLKRTTQTGGKDEWDTFLPLAVRSLNTRIVRIHGYTPAELIFGFTPRGIKHTELSDMVIMDGMDETAYRLRLMELDEFRDDAGQRMTQNADLIEKSSKGAWTQLEENDLVLVRRFRSLQSLGNKLEAHWEGPFGLTDISYHHKSGRLRDIGTGEIVLMRRWGLREKIHLNDMKLYTAREITRIPAVDSNAVFSNFEKWGRKRRIWEDDWRS
jgi:hypothetical protein